MQFIKSGELEVGVIRNSSYEYFAKKYLKPDENNVKIVSYDSWEELINDVSEGKIAIAYRYIMEIKMVIKQNPALAIKLKPAVISGTRDDIAIVINMNSPYLKYWIDSFVQRFMEQDARVMKETTLRRSQCIQLVEKNYKRSTLNAAIKYFCDSETIDLFDATLLLRHSFNLNSLFEEYVLQKRILR